MTIYVLMNLVVSSCSFKLEPLHTETVDTEKRDELRQELLALQDQQGIRLAHINNNWIKLVDFGQLNAAHVYYDCFGKARFLGVGVSGLGTQFVGLTDDGLAVISSEVRA